MGGDDRLGKKGLALTTGGSLGILGYLVGKLSPGDVKQLSLELLSVFKQQGPYGFYSLLLTLVFIGMLVGFVKLITRWKQEEINRICVERDKFQQLFIDDWKSTHKGKKK